MRNYKIYLMNERNERMFEGYEVNGNCAAVKAKLEEVLKTPNIHHALIEWGVAEEWGIEIYHAEGRLIAGKVDVQLQQW